MLKFEYIIHKETKVVIEYADWFEAYEQEKEMLLLNKNNTSKQVVALSKFNPKEIIFSNDFEIIYDSEFTLKEVINSKNGIEVLK